MENLEEIVRERVEIEGDVDGETIIGFYWKHLYNIDTYNNITYIEKDTNTNANTIVPILMEWKDIVELRFLRSKRYTFMSMFLES